MAKKPTTILREFSTDVFFKRYTYCPKNIIIGSRECKKCKFFKEKVLDNIKTKNCISNKQTTIYLSKGIVECKLT